MKISDVKPATMTARKINAELDKLSDARSLLNDAFIDAGRGDETTNQTLKKAGPDDPLALAFKAVSDRQQALHIEIESRYGPGAPSRLPKGVKPRE